MFYKDGQKIATLCKDLFSEPLPVRKNSRYMRLNIGLRQPWKFPCQCIHGLFSRLARAQYNPWRHQIMQPAFAEILTPNKTRGFD